MLKACFLEFLILTLGITVLRFIILSTTSHWKAVEISSTYLSAVFVAFLHYFSYITIAHITVLWLDTIRILEPEFDNEVI